MNLSISNIAWDKENDIAVYKMMKDKGFTGLEIAPTRIFPENPYEKNMQASEWSKNIATEMGFSIPSMQSIWYGRQEKLFGSSEERAALLDYTKKAIDFAAAIGCKNLVFGCPRNRYLEDENKRDIGVSFFKELGDYAFQKGTAIGMEANPTIYNTNYINDTPSALELIKQVDSKGFLLNLDVGTMIQNEENIDALAGNVKYINHVHISEPGLKPIEKREMHLRVKDILLNEGYKGFVSIEMGKCDNLDIIASKMDYIADVFW